LITSHTPESLRDFERLIAADFDAGLIRAPVHLAGGNEQESIEIFQEIRPQDYVLTQWRSHFHCLLKGVPPERLRAEFASVSDLGTREVLYRGRVAHTLRLFACRDLR